MKKKLLTEAMRVASTGLLKHPEFGNGRFLHWSFIVQDNAIITMATNRGGISPPVHLGYASQISNNIMGPKLHAEYNAWLRGRDLIKNKRWDIINIRLTKGGVVKISAPCNCCFNFLKSMGCSSCTFTTDSEWAKTQL